MQKLLPEKDDLKITRPEQRKEEAIEELELFSREIHHFSYEEFKRFPKKLKVQVIYSMFDHLHNNCGEALEKLFPYLFALKDKRYEIYARILFSEDLDDSEEPCLSKFLRIMREYSIKKRMKVNVSKIKKSIEYLKKNEVKHIDELYSLLPRKLFHKLKHFEKLHKNFNFPSKKEGWIWFLEKELELNELE